MWQRFNLVLFPKFSCKVSCMLIPTEFHVKIQFALKIRTQYLENTVTVTPKGFFWLVVPLQAKHYFY